MVAMNEPLETVDSYDVACDQLSFWAGELRRMGLTPQLGVYFKPIRLAGRRRPVYRIYLSRQES